MRRTTTLSAAALLGITLLTSPGATAPSASADGETCQGVPATIVGSGTSGTLRGTAGRDVIVTAGAPQVAAGGGDDLVCVTGATHPHVDAGPGDDVVDASAASGSQTVLGAGADQYIGSTGFDHVTGGYEDDDYRELDAERDIIDTGGAGILDSVDSGQDGVPNADEVRMAGGSLRWSGTAAAGAVLDGGAGSNLLFHPADDEDLTIDVGAGTIAAAGQPTLTISGFTSYFVYQRAGSLDFRGTDRDEELMLTTGRPPRTTVSMGAGDDALRLDIGAAFPAGSSYDAGAGRDMLEIIIPETVVGLDLRSGDLATGRAGRWKALATGFEDASVMAREIEIGGTPGANNLRVYACRSTVRARGGADSVSAFGTVMDERLACRGRQGRWFGDGGNDTLRGTTGPDVLVGGPGQDRADGGAGRDVDVCRAERTTRCEVRRL